MVLSFDYELQYKSGKENVAVDALFRAQGTEILYLDIYVVSSNLHDLIAASYTNDDYSQEILLKLHQNQVSDYYFFFKMAC